ncbi:MAG: MFS transporter [Candidatus Xenobia bacterium]
MRVSFEVLQDRTSQRLFLGQLISQTCDKMMSVGLVWLFTERYPAFVIPLFLGVSALPHLLLAWRAGQWASRWGQVRTLVGSDLWRGVLFVLLAGAWSQVDRSAWLATLLGVSFVSNLASAVFNPAIMSAPVALVDESRLQALTALIESCFNVGNVIGPLLAAVLYPALGLRGLFLLNGLSYLLAAALEAGIRSRAAAPEEEAPRASPREVLTADPAVTAMLGGFLASNLCLAPIMVIMPLFVRACYHGALSTLAGLETWFGIGTILGGMALSAVRLESHLGPRIAGGMIAVAAAYLAFTMSTGAGMGFVALAVLGFFLATTNVLSMTVFQTRLPGQDVPTLMSLVNLIGVASLPLSMAVMGVAVSHFPVRSIALACSGGLALATLVVVMRREVRAL